MRTALLLAFVFVQTPLQAQELPQPAPLPVGSSKIVVDVGPHKLDVFTYKPENFKDGPLIVIFHGTERNAEDYREFGKSLAERIGATVAAPLFDNKRFPTDLYHNGGLLRKGKLQPEDQLTGNLTPKIAAEFRRLEGRPKWPYYFFGHSAGGQFLSRTSGFVSLGAVRIVAANPGAHLFPTRELPYPYGFGNLPKEISDDDAIQLYLAQPLTIYVGTADLEKAQLPMGETAMKQGPNRWMRGKNCFKMAQELALAKGWSFHWRLVEAPGIAHNGKGMLDHPNSIEALFGIPAEKRQAETEKKLESRLSGQFLSPLMTVLGIAGDRNHLRHGIGYDHSECLHLGEKLGNALFGDDRVLGLKARTQQNLACLVENASSDVQCDKLFFGKGKKGKGGTFAHKCLEKHVAIVNSGNHVLVESLVLPAPRPAPSRTERPIPPRKHHFPPRPYGSAGGSPAAYCWIGPPSPPPPRPPEPARFCRLVGLGIPVFSS